MGMTVQRRKDSQLPRVFMHKIADIRGGVSVNSTELSGADYLREGTPVSAPIDGQCHVVKIAEIAEAVTETGKTLKVKKGHYFVVGDIVMAAAEGAAYAITGIDASNSAYDSITVGTTLGALAKEAFLYQAKASGASGAAFKYEPFALVGTGKPIVKGDNIDTDAWIIGVTKGNALPEGVASKLKGIINY